MRAASSVTAICGLCLFALVMLPATAPARTFVPRHHRVFHGVTDTGEVKDFTKFRWQVGAHPAVLEDFYHWDTPLTTGALSRWDGTRTRGVLSLSTAPGGKREIITPRQIASGHGDDYLVKLGASIADAHQVVYIRLFPEMNGHWNPYCAFNKNGSKRGPAHSTHAFRRAWRRVVLIVRGGRRKKVNRELRHLGMPNILRAGDGRHHHVYQRHDVGLRLPRPKVAFMWNPQTTGSPLVRGNAPRDYWPGARYVDWVGADIYSAYASAAFPALNRFYRHWRHWPFEIGEYSPWDRDRRGRFIRRLFDWARKHGRTHMLIYYRDVTPDNIFNIQYYPASHRALRHELNSQRFMPYAPGTRH